MVGLAASLGTTASAQIFNTVSRGWISSIPEAPDVVDTTNDNYCTGFLNDPWQPFELRSFYIFDLPQSLERVYAADLELYLPSEGYVGGPSLEISFFDVDPASAVALVEGRIGTPGLFEDLGTGECFGTFTVYPNDAGLFRSFLFWDPLVDRINESEGLFALGCRLTRSGPDSEEFVFGYTGWAAEPADGHTYITLYVDDEDVPVGPVPEPVTSALCGVLTLLWAAFWRGRRRHRAVAN
ncbi:MAG TPA: hypothetical protein VK178_05080 [Opitutaceae bacterium]|nr:hypothetical protein [Opitutaceae bacterium]